MHLYVSNYIHVCMCYPTVTDALHTHLLHPLPPTPTQTVVHHVLLWGSVLFTFLFNYVYTAIDSQQKFMDTYWIMQAASTRPQFWFLLLLAPVVCLFPRSVTLSSVAVYYYTLYVHVLHINTIGIPLTNF